MGIEWEDRQGTKKRGPSWSQLVDAAAFQLGFQDPALLRARGEDLQILEYFRSRNDGRLAPLTNWLVQQLDVPDEVLASDQTYSALAGLQLCSTVYTTNFDDFLERGLRLNGRQAEVVASETEIRNLLAARVGDATICEVLKFHGDLNHPDEMVVTDSDYRSRLALEKAMDARLRADLLGRVVLFIGYSFRDWNVSYLFHLIQRLQGRLPGSVSGRRGFITVSDPSDFEVQLFNARNIGVIAVGRQSITADVAALIQSIGET